MCICIYVCRNVCVFLNAYICDYAHLHFWSIISIIYCALYGNLYHLFVFVNWIVWSKSWINDSLHIPVPFELFIHLIKIGRVYIQPPFSSYTSVLYMFITFWFITNGCTYTFIVSAFGPKPWVNNYWSSYALIGHFMWRKPLHELYKVLFIKKWGLKSSTIIMKHKNAYI